MILNDDILTNNGRVSITAARHVDMKARDIPAEPQLFGGRAETLIFTDGADIRIRAGENVTARHLVTRGAIDVEAIAGNLDVMTTNACSPARSPSSTH